MYVIYINCVSNTYRRKSFHIICYMSIAGNDFHVIFIYITRAHWVCKILYHTSDIFDMHITYIHTYIDTSCIAYIHMYTVHGILCE